MSQSGDPAAQPSFDPHPADAPDDLSWTIHSPDSWAAGDRQQPRSGGVPEGAPVPDQQPNVLFLQRHHGRLRVSLRLGPEGEGEEFKLTI